MRRFAILAAGAALCGAALAQESKPAEPNLGSGLVLPGAPTMQDLLAQQKACEAKKPQRKGSGTLGELTYKRLERIMAAVAKNDYNDAEPKLVELSESTSGDYEKAIVMQTLAYVYAMQNKHAQSIKAYEGALATNALPQQAHEAMMLNVAQLYMSTNQMQKGTDALVKYLDESCMPSPDAHILYASILADKKDWPASLKQVDLALVKAKQPKESWLQLKLALHHEMRETTRCAEVLVHLIAMSPMKETYFKQLYGVLAEIKKDPEALAVLALAERRGFIDEEPEYRSLADMYMFMEIPLKAAQLMERGFAAKKIEANDKNLEKLANGWFAAREYEKAEAAMARAAAASNKGELWKQLAAIQMEKEKWGPALDALRKAQQKGGLKYPGEVDFLMGVCATNLKQWKTADASLRAAMAHEKYVKQATEWLNHMRDEQAYAEGGRGNGNGDGNGNGAAPAADDAKKS